ncbi:sensor histidine kinase [Fulvivirga lutimaris]|uniref:sensor histidine kinase n=1 Tax=Fulvivirga lutimaris TaxID=1819566 RepID=UPI0012BD671B|nr:sensor histidine kinase [Fulvivirga lutimaris]MTI41958.1 sensor histidine kinase [Fulvivirga lutimaris]
MSIGRVLVAFFLFCTLNSFGQNQIRFERITVEDGLSQSSIKSMVQDKYGYLWVATLDGINKYDGNRFYQYHHIDDDPASIPRNNIHRLFIDNNQNLWVSSEGSLSQYIQEENKFVSYNLIADEVNDSEILVHDMFQQSDSIFLIASNLGMWAFNINNEKLIRTPQFFNFSNQEVRNFVFNEDGSIWVATDRAVYHKNTSDNDFNELLEHDSRITFYYSKQTNEVYIHGRDSLSKYNPITNRFNSIYNFSDSEKIGEFRMPIMQLSNGELWVLRRDAFIFDSQGKHKRTLKYVHQDPFALSSDYLSCIYQTKDEVVWIGTNGLGLNKYSPQFSVFNYYGSFAGAPISLSSNFVTAVTTKDDNTIYVATMEGLDIINQNENNTFHININSIDGDKSRINSILLEEDNDLWLGTSHGLRKWDGHEIEYIENNDKIGATNTTINELLKVSPSSFLVATNTGVYLFNTNTYKSKKLSATSTSVMMIFEGKLWAEKFNDIIKYDTSDYLISEEIKIGASGNSSFPDASIKCFYSDTEGAVWVGTAGGGLVHYDIQKNHFQTFTEKDGLPNSVIYGILEDDQNNLWLSTNKGIAVFSKTEMRCIRSFNTTHGLQGNEFNTKAFYQSPSGKMYFGGVNGLTSFNPKEANALISDIPKCIVTSLLINGVRKEEIGNGTSLNQILTNRKMELAWNERNFGFEISSLGFSYPAHTSYQYTLEGYEKSWNLLENERRIQFTNIPPGKYTLRAKASNSFGEWEKEGLELVITVTPPLWRTPWFIILIVGMITLFIYSIFQWRTRRLRLQTALLEKLVNERTQKLQIQQEEIQAANEELTAQSELMDERNTELERVKDSLEERVEERTTTLQKVNEELVDQNTKLEQFAFITAHNIKGPVAQVKGLINLLKIDDSEVLQLLSSSINDLDQVISDLSIVLSIRKGMGNLIEPVELKEQLTLALKMLTEDIKKVNGTVNINEFKEVHIEGLRPYVYSIFYNLIHNALKYRSEERDVVINCSNILIEGEKIKIMIEDNGIGIDMNYAENKIFNLYQRFHPERIGKGFGLFLTKAHVEAMKGTITVESEVDRGTRFTMEFPVCKEVIIKTD